MNNNVIELNYDSSFIDYLSLTSGINYKCIPYKPKAFIRKFTPHEKHKFKKGEACIKKCKCKGNKCKNSKVCNLRKLYKYVFYIKLSKNRGVYAVLCLQPTPFLKVLDNTPAFLRLEFNPSKMRDEDYRLLLKRLIALFGPTLAESILNRAIVTRYDPAIDLPDMDVRDYTYHANNKQVSEFVGTEAKGLTLYLGQRRGSRCSFLRLYAKLKEMEHKGQQYFSNYNEVLRIEHCNKNRIPLHELADQPSPFSSLKVYNDFTDDDRFSTRFIKRCKRYGIPHALHKIKSEKRRRRYLRWMKKYEVKLLDHDELGQQFKEVSQDLLKNLKIAT